MQCPSDLHQVCSRPVKRDFYSFTENLDRREMSGKDGKGE